MLRNRSLQYAEESLVDLIMDCLPDYLSSDNVKVNIAPEVSLSLAESSDYYCVISFQAEQEFSECVDGSRSAVKRDFTLFIGSHENEKLIEMYDDIMGEDSESGLPKISQNGKDYFESVIVKKGANPFIFYDSGLCELVLSLTIIN